MNSFRIPHRLGQHLSFLWAGFLFLSLGCDGSSAELARARQAEAEASKRLQECEIQLAETRKALEAARHSSSKAHDFEAVATAAWKAAGMTADVFLAAVNSRDADGANTAGTQEFQAKNGGKKAIDGFAEGRFRGRVKQAYTCAPLTRLEAVPGKEEFVGRGGVQYQGVPRQDSSYTLRIVKEGDNWRIASFTAVER
jgi:hypothetical protein